MHPVLNIAVSAARRAGDIIIRSVDRRSALTITRKNTNDFVTDVDQRAEQAIIQVLRKAYPDHGILAEESGHSPGDDYLWIIDPLDGTTNFIHDFPHYAVSIALQHKGAIEHAVIYDPIRQELFTASRGQGAHLNNRRLRVSTHKGLEGALLGTSLPLTSSQPKLLDGALKTLHDILPSLPSLRGNGSCALDLAYVAASRLDGYWAFGQQIWDMAAGVLLIKEAGGLVTDHTGADNYLSSGNIIAATPKLFKALFDVIAQR